MRTAWCSSGGKDSLLALWHAKARGLNVTTMVTMFDETGSRSRSHGISLPLAQEQAARLNMSLIAPSASWRDYETVFTSHLHALRADGHDSVVFGDIDLQPHRDWEEKVCAAADLTAVLPLWQRDRQELATEFLQLGFRAIVVCVDHRFLSADYCGRDYDAAFLQALPENVDACGENGEFHTFVYDGPLFEKALPVTVEQLDPYQAPTEFGGHRYTFARLRET